LKISRPVNVLLIVVALAGMIGGVAAGTKIPFNYDVLSLLPAGSEAAHYQREMVKRSDYQAEAIIFTADSMDDLPMPSSYEGITYELSFRERGTALVRVARRDGWSRELELLGTDTGAGMLAVPGGVVVVGQPHPEVDTTALVLFLSAADGSERARATFRARNNVGVGALVFNGRYAVVKLGNTVRAYDPASGVEVWAVGHANPVESPRRHR